MKRGLFLLALLSCAAPARAPAPKSEAVVTFHVLSETGAPLPLAHVRLLDSAPKPHVVAGDGSLRLPLSAFAERVVPVEVSGAGHRVETIVIARDDGPLDVTVKLGTFGPYGDVKPLLLFYSEPDPEPRPMQRDGDGPTFSLEVEAPDGRYGYEIAGVTSEGVSGSPIDGWTQADPEFRYRPEIVMRGGRARITFDPRTVKETWTTVTFSNPASSSAAVSAVALRTSLARQKDHALMGELFHAKDGPRPDAVERLDEARARETSAIRQELAPRLAAEARPIVWEATALGYFQGPELESPTPNENLFATRILDRVPPDDALWGVFGSIENVLKAAGASAKTRAYADAFIAKQRDDAEVAGVLLSRLEESESIPERRALLAELKKPRFEHTLARLEADAFDPDRPLARGHAVSFEVKTLTGTTLTPKALAGKTYLIDVWGTWCAPCVAEMPRLHELYAKYGGQRFEIVSIALEHDASAVKKFREDKAHPMPWLHGVGDPDTFLKSFAGSASVGVPLYVLVDGEGKIIDATPHLRPKELPALVEQALGRPDRPAP